MTAIATLRAAIATYASAASVSRSSRSTRAAPSRLAAAIGRGGMMGALQIDASAVFPPAEREVGAVWHPTATEASDALRNDLWGF